MGEQVLDHRRIGCSDVAAVLGRDRYREPVDVWMRIVHGVEPERSAVLEEMGDMGKALERVVAEEGLRRKLKSEAPLYRPPSITPRGRDWQRYSLDWVAGVVVGGWTHGFVQSAGPRIIETKVRSYWQIHGEEHGWGEDGSADVAEDVLLQVTAQLEAVKADRDSWLGTDVPDLEQVEVLVLVDGQRLRHYPVPYDAELASMVREECERFWRDHVLTGTPPALQFGEGTRRYLKHRHPTLGDAIEADEAMERVAKEQREIAEALGQLEARRDVLGARMAALAGDASRIHGEGWSWSQYDVRGRTSWHAVAIDLSERCGLDAVALKQLEEQYSGKPYRANRLTTTKKGPTT